MSKHVTKLLFILFALTLAIFLTACGASNTSSTDTATDSPAVSASDTAGADMSATDTANPDASPTDTSGADVSPSDTTGLDAGTTDTTSPDVSPSDSPSPSDTTGTDVSPSDSPSPSDSSTPAAYPKVTLDKTGISVGETVTFKVVTSQNVKKIQAIIDGKAGKSYTSYKTSSGLRNWMAKITFTAAGNRKVKFKCSMVSGSTVIIPSNAVAINVSSTTSYTASPASKTINSGSSVTFTLDTPSSITSVYAVIDGVKQSTVSKASSIGGVKKWKVNITFHKTGSRNVIFKACAGSTVKKSFPGTPITVTVN